MGRPWTDCRQAAIAQARLVLLEKGQQGAGSKDLTVAPEIPRASLYNSAGRGRAISR
jgi:hypothetical protein